MDKLRGVPTAAWVVMGLAGLAIVLLLVLLSSSSSESSVSYTGSGYPNGDLSNTRYERGPINSSSVTDLQVAWTLPITATGPYGGYASSPIITNGVIYSQDLESNVQAIDLETGEVLWKRTYEQPNHGPTGVVVAEGRVYGATPTDAFALDQETGEPVWSVTLPRNKHEGIDMAPGYKDGIVYVSTVPLISVREEYVGGGAGIVWALDAKTGKKIWEFKTVTRRLWGNPQVNSGGGLWYTPAFDDKGSMYIGIGNPGPFPGTPLLPWGSSRTGRNLFTDSLVKLDTKTGKMEWYYQLTPHDINDWDLQDPPILIKAGGKDLVIGAGKAGIVLALDAASGKLVWERSVGIHNGYDDIGLDAMVGDESRLKTPMEIYPGALGGVIAPMSTDRSTIFVPVINDPLTLESQTKKKEFGPFSGEVVAIDAATGKVRWKQESSDLVLGSTTVVNDLVFTTSANGNVTALDTKDGSVVWRENLPADTNSGVAIEGDTVIAPAGLAGAQGQSPQIVAYRLGG